MMTRCGPTLLALQRPTQFEIQDKYNKSEDKILCFTLNM